MRYLKFHNVISRVSRLASRCLSRNLQSSIFNLQSSSGFTLMEVNLAIFIMAVGLLAMVALYPLAYRENRQSKDDVKAAAAADCVLNTLAAALSSRNIEWRDWVSGIDSAWNVTGKDRDLEGGWLAYCDWESHGKYGTYAPKKRGTINSTAKRVFDSLAGINKNHKPSWPLDNELVCAIVAQWGQIPVNDGDQMRMEEDRSRVGIGVRVARRSGDILSQPLFYTEVHFQGDQKDLKE